MSETDWKSKPENKTSLYQLNGCNVVFPSDLASSNSNNDIFLDLQKTSHILPIPIPFLCLFSTLFTMLSQYLLMLQALYTCLIYAPCISLSSSPELIPCEFSEAFLKKTSFSRSTSLCGQHHMWRAHSNCYTSRPTNSLAEDEKQNSALAIPFFSYTQSYYVSALSKLTLVSSSLWVIPKWEGQEKLLRWGFVCFCSAGLFFGWKAPDWRSRKTHIFLVLTEISHSVKMFKYHSSWLDFFRYFSRKIVWILIAIKTINCL